MPAHLREGSLAGTTPARAAAERNTRSAVAGERFPSAEDVRVNDRKKPAPEKSSVTRREFLKRSAAAAPLPAVLAQSSAKPASAPGDKNRPNIVIIIADQFRWDAVGAAGLSPMALTPNLDVMARRGVLFQSAITNQ